MEGWWGSSFAGRKLMNSLEGSLLVRQQGTLEIIRPQYKPFFDKIVLWLIIYWGH